MSHFYGTIDGKAETQATRCGTKNSGLTTFCASWEGAVKCSAYQKNGIDHVCVEKTTWQGKGESRILYDGPIGVPPENAS